MQQEMESFALPFLQALESGIEKLPQNLREDLYRPCAVQCAQGYVLKEQQRQFAECHGDLDLQYEKYGRSEYFFADIIERGHIYEIGYPRCLCPLAQAGASTPAGHCECSRQSILYVLHTLLPDKTIRVEQLHTVLTGAGECRFRVTIDT